MLNIFFDFELLISTIILIKILFLFFFFLDLFFEKIIKLKSSTYFIKRILKYEHYFEIIFEILMSLLLIYLFYPNKPIKTKLFHYETKLLLFSYGIILFFNFLKNFAKMIIQNENDNSN